MGQYHNERDVAQNDYINKVQQAAETRNTLADEMGDFNSFTSDTDKDIKEQQVREEELKKALVSDSNKLTKDIQANQTSVDDSIKNYGNTLATKIANKTARNNLINGYMQVASDEAKTKYELASQRLAQAQAQWNTFKNVFQGAGAVAKMFGPWGVAIGVALDGIGGIGSAIGSANA